MDEKVIPLRAVGGADDLDDSSTSIVATLEHFLEMAKAGTLSGVGIFVVAKGSEVRVTWAGSADSHLMVSGASRLYFESMMAQYTLRAMEK